MTDILLKHDIQPSIQRIRVLEYLLENRGHPAAEQIFNALKDKLRTLSKATVYNTLSVFAEKGLVRILTLENTESRYDLVTDCHGHFLCESCGRISDFKIEIDSFETKALDDYAINQKDVFFKGFCPECISINKKEVKING